MTWRDTPVEQLGADAWTIPTEAPQSDGTFTWHDTTLVTVQVSSRDQRGFGYSYGSAAMRDVIHDALEPAIRDVDVMDIERAWWAMQDAVRNLGRPGIAASAISAVDWALWDLKARLLGVPLVRLLGAVRDAVPAYASGLFTSSSRAALASEATAWRDAGLRLMKMKVGRDPAEDPHRVAVVREAVGDGVTLMVDANGAYRRTEAARQAAHFAQLGVTWFEEPVSSDDLAGLRFVRERAPSGMEVAAGEYGYDPGYFRRLLEADAVDVLQADATRCLGLTGFLAVACLCEAFHVPLSAHTAPALHVHAGCAAAPLVHVEYFLDHVRIESIVMDGFHPPRDGWMVPDPSVTGHGLTFRAAAADRLASSRPVSRHTAA